MDRLEIAKKEAELLEAGTPYAAVTIVEAENIARTEAKMLVLADETIYGTVGGGAGERLAIRDAAALLAEGKNAIRHYELSSPLSEAGKACGGRLTVFIESCRSTRPQLIMVGGGHVGTALIRAAKLTGFTVTLLDTRGEEQIGAAIETADRFIPLRSFGEVEKIKLPAGACYVVATYSHATDGEALGGVLRHTDAAYIGMIGSRRKIGAIYEKLEAEGFTPKQLVAVHAPIGLALGGEMPEEIAVSILAEILMTRHGRTKADL